MILKLFTLELLLFDGGWLIQINKYKLVYGNK